MATLVSYIWLSFGVGLNTALVAESSGWSFVTVICDVGVSSGWSFVTVTCDVAGNSG